MSYQVLARKWRPAKFAELVGQDHVKSAIINGLTQQRTHHAYLFTGTRGVGKTTIARIFAKSLNCEAGISAEPCGTCSVCLDVDAGRFVDLIEIDAASRTKVGDTREILDNVQYAPTRGRYKIYLIDEVHMLSRHSFNALLKTLEEPPEHVKFLFATTDPQKLPVTILSRCLQFNLQALSEQQIGNQLDFILNAESISFEPAATQLLARYARGSMRDGLSLTDQAIAQSGQNVTLDIVKQMLGTVDQTWSQQILLAVSQKDSSLLVDLFARLRQQQPDFEKVFDDLITLTHQVAMCQLLPAAAQLSDTNQDLIKSLSETVSPEQVQVNYQLLLQSKRELPYTSDSAAALEMACLRLLAFNPAEPQIVEKKNTEVKASLEARSEPKGVVKGAPEKAQSDADSAQPANSEQASSAEQESSSQQPVEHKQAIESKQLLNEPLAEVEQVVKQDSVASIKDDFFSHSSTETNTATNPALNTEAQASEALTTAEPISKTTDEYADYNVMYDESDYDDSKVSSYAEDYQPNSPKLSSSAGVSVEVANKSQLNNTSESLQPAGDLNEQEQQAPLSHLKEFPDNEEQNPVLAILASRGMDISGMASGSTTNNQSASAINAGTIHDSSNDSSDEPSNKLSATQTETDSTANLKCDEVPNLNQNSNQNQLVVDESQLKTIESDAVRYAHEVDKWAAMIEQSHLQGLGRQLALNSEVKIDGNRIELVVRQEFAHLLNEKSEQELTAVVSNLAPASEFIINKSALTVSAPADIQQNINVNRQQRAEESIHQDPMVNKLINEFGAKLIDNSIKPL